MYGRGPFEGHRTEWVSKENDNENVNWELRTQV